jgi:hypothetical protein
MSIAEHRAGAGEITLRRTTPDDLPTIFEQQCDPESNALAGTKPRTREVFFATWERHFTDPGINPRVIEAADARVRMGPPPATRMPRSPASTACRTTGTRGTSPRTCRGS